MRTGSDATTLQVWRRVTQLGQGTLDMKSFTIVGAPAPIGEANPDPTVRSYPAPGVPEPHEYLPEMKDAIIVKHTIQALSPRVIAVHGPTGTGKSTVFPLAITHWTDHAEGLTPGLTVCAQPRRIMAQQLCESVELQAPSLLPAPLPKALQSPKMTMPLVAQVRKGVQCTRALHYDYDYNDNN